MEKLISRLKENHIPWETDCLLSPRSAFRIGGTASLALFPQNGEQLLVSARILGEEKIPYYVIGKASNVVFSDQGVAGAVLFTGDCRRMECTGERIHAEAGASLASIANTARDHGLTGAEFLHGIPGTLGGAVFMNAGAYGGCMEQICTRVTYFDPIAGEKRTISGDALSFGVRQSVFSAHPEYVIVEAELSLAPGDREEIGRTMRDFMERRRRTQPLEYPSAGSVFKRPPGYFAGKLIEDCGLKGSAIGGAEVSRKHAGFIINRGGATARDVRMLTERVQKTVLEATGVAMECEIRFLDGFFPADGSSEPS